MRLIEALKYKKKTASNTVILELVSGEKRNQRTNTHIGIQQHKNPAATRSNIRVSFISLTELVSWLLNHFHSCSVTMRLHYVDAHRFWEISYNNWKCRHTTVKQKVIQQWLNNERFTFTCWVIKGAHCVASNKIDFNPICDSDNQQVKCKEKPQATQPYLRCARRKNLIVVVRFTIFM